MNNENDCAANSRREHAAKKRSGVLERVVDLLAERHNQLPIWIRAPKRGSEHYTGLSRSKLYELATKRLIQTVSIREPGQIKGTRLFNLASILAYIAGCETGMDLSEETTRATHATAIGALHPSFAESQATTTKKGGVKK